MRASDLTEGQVIDLEPIARQYGGVEDVMVTEDEYATVESARPAEPVAGVAAAVLSTSLGNYKIPADTEVEVITY